MKHLRRLLVVVAALCLGALVVEGVFRIRDQGAFPHLNVYVADAERGVRLVPHSTEKISFSGNPVSSVRINAAGYRGADWPARQDGELFIVGDSQAFGLGVAEEASFAQRLGQRLHRPVANGAVPTYGPAEYNAVLAEELPRRRPRTVIYTINLANDLFEAAHANTTRHAVWDGWAVRKETAPASVQGFPGRTLLYRDSHAFFALRGLLFRRSGAPDGAVASEGSWRDLEVAGKAKAQEEAEIRAAAERDRKAREQKLAEARSEMKKLDGEIGKVLDELPIELDDGDAAGIGTLRAAKANPGDIVRVYYGEGSQPVPAIAEQIRAASVARKKFEDRLREKKDAKTLAALVRRDSLDEQAKQIRSEQAPGLRPNSPLRAHLERARALCTANGAELVVLVLPLDVQVSDKEWAKYHAPPIDLSASRVLADDVLALADVLGVRAVDAWPALAAAEPGAFLDGDLHMSPRGHDAVAQAIERVLTTPPMVQRVIETPLPLGRSPVPAPDEWVAARGPEPAQHGDWVPDVRRLGCEVDQLREWLRLSCKKATMRLSVSGRGEPMVLNTPDGSTLVVAQLEGARFQLTGYGTRRFYVRSDWALGEDQPSTDAYVESLPKGPVPKPTADELALCECHKQATGSKDCSTLYGAADHCVTSYPGDCRAQLRCARGDRATAPVCTAGEKQTPVALRCEAPPPGPKPGPSKASLR